MNRLIRAVAGVCVAAGLMACPPKPAGNCGGTACTATERCDADSLKCVADAAPVITLDSPPVVSTATFTVTGTITDDAQVTSAEWRTGTRPFTSIDLQSGGAFTITVDAPVLDAENIVLTLRASDGKNETTLSRDVKIDRVGPAVELQSPDAGSAHNTASITVALKVTDGSGALSELLVDGQTITNPMSGATVMTSVAVPASANNTLLEVPVVAADSRGNRTMTSLSFYGDRVAPVVAITSPVASDVVATPMMNVTFTATDPSALTATCASTTGAPANATTTDGMSWTCVLPVPVEERPETVTVVVTDAAGNSATQMVTFAIDRVAPMVVVNSPTANFIAGQPLMISATTMGALTTVTAKFMGGAPVMMTGGPTAWTATLPLPQHDYAIETVMVEATDMTGNVGAATVVGATDVVAPVITITAPMANQRFNIASFTGGNTSVRTSWTVTDADPMANANTTYNGAPNTAGSIDRPTAPTDNGLAYSGLVVATDRAGNTASASITYSVDVVSPTVVSWVPAANARNFAPRNTVITFSEPIATSGDPVTISPGGLTPTWDGPRRVWTNALDNHALSTVTLTFRTDLADDHGNPVTGLPAQRRFYVGTDRAPNTFEGLDVIGEFDAASDSDGILSVATTGNARLGFFRDNGSVMQPISTGITRGDLFSVTLNSSNVVNPTTLLSSQRLGLVVFGTTTWTRWSDVDGVAATDVGSNPLVAVVSQAPFAFEGTSPIATITGTTLTRSPKTWPLSFSAGGSLRVLQSNGGIIVLNGLGSSLEWTRFYCGANGFGQFCTADVYRSTNAATGPERGSAITRSGSCAALAWGSRIVFQTTPACQSLGSCTGDLAVASVARPNSERFGTWDAPGEDTLLVAYRSGELIGVNKLAAGTCGLANSVAVIPPTRLIGVLPGSMPEDFLPVRVGTHVGIVYRRGTSIGMQVF